MSGPVNSFGDRAAFKTKVENFDAGFPVCLDFEDEVEAPVLRELQCARSIPLKKQQHLSPSSQPEMILDQLSHSSHEPHETSLHLQEKPKRQSAPPLTARFVEIHQISETAQIVADAEKGQSVFKSLTSGSEDLNKRTNPSLGQPKTPTYTKKPVEMDRNLVIQSVANPMFAQVYADDL